MFFSVSLVSTYQIKMETNKFIIFSVSLIFILGAVESFEYLEKELETEEGLQDMYERWRVHHKVAEKSPDRFNVFKHNVQHVHKTNKMNKPYKLKVNKFAAMTNYEFVNTYADSKLGHNMALRGNLKDWAWGFSYENQTDLPKSIDWRQKNAVAPIKNQGQCGMSSCKKICRFEKIYNKGVWHFGLIWFVFALHCRKLLGICGSVCSRINKCHKNWATGNVIRTTTY